MAWQRPDNRSANQVRPLVFETDFTKFAIASVLTRCGDTQVLCTISIEPGVPRFLEETGQGWLSAEYRMLPGATPQRQRRELMRLSGRTQEIQRLIGRSLRAALDLQALGERTVLVDADVLQADAGTRTTAITGGFVALAMAMEKLVQQGELQASPLRHQVAAVSVGSIEEEPFLDLNYPEDTAAEVDFNVVMNERQEFIEVQGTAESDSFTRQQLNQLMDLAESGIQDFFASQKEAIIQAVGNFPIA